MNEVSFSVSWWELLPNGGRGQVPKVVEPKPRCLAEKLHGPRLRGMFRCLSHCCTSFFFFFCYGPKSKLFSRISITFPWLKNGFTWNTDILSKQVTYSNCLFIGNIYFIYFQVLDCQGSCDNSQLISCSMDKSVVLWDVTSGNFTRKWRGHQVKKKM